MENNSTPTMADEMTRYGLNKETSVRFDTGKILSGKDSPFRHIGWSSATPFTPKVNPEILWQKEMGYVVRHLHAMPEEALYITGPAGCGKSYSIKQLFARMNYPVWETNGYASMEMSEVKGDLRLDDKGRPYMRPGPLVLAMKYGGLLLFNELDMCDPALLAELNTYLDGSVDLVFDGEKINKHPAFRFIATGNSRGKGDTTGMYTGIGSLNQATLDRFSVIGFNYQTPERECVLAQRWFPDINMETLTKFYEFIDACRQLLVDGCYDTWDIRLDVPISIRGCKRTLALYMMGGYAGMKNEDGLWTALYQSIFSKANPDALSGVKEIYQRFFPNTKYWD